MPHSTSSSSDANRPCVQARPSIVFAGHPGARKTTLMSCTTAELDSALRVVVAEEVFEADIPLPNVPTCRPARPAPTASQSTCGGSWRFLRMAPDVAIEALPLSLTIAATLCVLHEGCDAHVHDRAQCSRAHLD
jgi:pilus assembly protein CpaF